MILSGEHLLILFFILLFVGPRFLPELGATFGKAVRNMKDGLSGVKEPTYRKISETIIGEPSNPQDRNS